MATTPDDPRPQHPSRRRPVLFSRPPLDDPEALERWITDFVDQMNAAIEASR